MHLIRPLSTFGRLPFVLELTQLLASSPTTSFLDRPFSARIFSLAIHPPCHCGTHYLILVTPKFDAYFCILRFHPSMIRHPSIRLQFVHLCFLPFALQFKIVFSAHNHIHYRFKFVIHLSHCMERPSVLRKLPLHYSSSNVPHGFIHFPAQISTDA